VKVREASGCELTGAQGWWGEAPERTKTLRKANYICPKYDGLGRYAAEPWPLVCHPLEAIAQS